MNGEELELELGCAISDVDWRLYGLRGEAEDCSMWCALSGWSLMGGLLLDIQLGEGEGYLFVFVPGCRELRLLIGSMVDGGFFFSGSLLMRGKRMLMCSEGYEWGLIGAFSSPAGFELLCRCRSYFIIDIFWSSSAIWMFVEFTKALSCLGLLYDRWCALSWKRFFTWYRNSGSQMTNRLNDVVMTFAIFKKCYFHQRSSEILARYGSSRCALAHIDLFSLWRQILWKFSASSFVWYNIMF